MPYRAQCCMQGQENTISGQLTVFDLRRRHGKHRAWSSSPAHSMAFLPYNCSAYQVFIKSEMPNLDLGALDSLGYQTVGDSPVSVHLVEPSRTSTASSALKRSIIEDDFAELTPVVCAIASATAQATRRFSSCTRTRGKTRRCSCST
ncbi:MAG: hypothetical protein ACLR4Z_03535 [Butyricicoccaceae bacterium]